MRDGGVENESEGWGSRAVENESERWGSGERE